MPGAPIYGNIDPRLRIVVKSADQTLSNNVNPQPDNELKFAVGPYQVWAFDAFILSISTVVADFKTSFNSPAGSLCFYSCAGDDINGNVTFLTERGTGAGPAMSWQGIGSDILSNHFSGIIINQATPGDLQFKWSQNNNEVSDTKVLKDSCLILHRLA